MHHGRTQNWPCYGHSKTMLQFLWPRASSYSCRFISSVLCGLLTDSPLTGLSCSVMWSVAVNVTSSVGKWCKLQSVSSAQETHFSWNWSYAVSPPDGVVRFSRAVLLLISLGTMPRVKILCPPLVLYISPHSQNCKWMEVSGQLRVPAALHPEIAPGIYWIGGWVGELSSQPHASTTLPPGKDLPVPIGDWVVLPEPVWTLWRRRNSLAPVGNRYPNPSLSRSFNL
jgi:hypothetical protein